MRLRRKNNLSYFTFHHLERFPELVHGVFSRQGGKSSGAFAANNIGRTVGDDDKAVACNREAIVHVFGGGELAFLSQVHGTGIAVINDARHSDESHPPEADGIVTDTSDRLLVIQVADCQPVLLYDPEHRAVANIHSGWRGSIANIIDAGVSAMRKRFDTDPDRLIAGIGPSLGPCCAEFIHYREEIPEVFWKYKDAADRFNFWQISQDQLTAAGVRPENIEFANICTKCNPHLFYSYRKTNTTGRFAAVIGLR